MAEHVVVFGNCQAESIGSAFRSAPGLIGAEYLYIPSFNITEQEVAERLSPEILQSCTLLFEQVMPQIHLPAKYVFPNAKRITFGSLDFNALWPLRAEEKRATPELPDYPFGRYPYGDRVINEISAQGFSAEEAWGKFVERSAVLMPNLDRLWKIEEERWQHLEAGLDVRMSDLVFRMIKDKRLFHTYNHPSRQMLCYFGGRILQAAGLAPLDDQAAGDLMWGLLTWEFGASYQQPIHPLVATHFGLTWWSPDMLYRRFDVELPYDTFIQRQIAWA